jgi:hypothetical protein
VQLALVRPAPRILACAERYAAAHPERVVVDLLATAPADDNHEGAVVVHPVGPQRGAASPDAFDITIGPRIDVTAAGLPGAFYALQELFALLEAHEGRCIPAARIRATPAVPRRWICIDASASAPRRAYLEDVIDLLATFRVNGVVLTLHTNFAYQSVAGLGGPDALNAADLKALSAYAHERFITLVPGIDMRRVHAVLLLERYRQSSGPSRAFDAAAVGGLYAGMVTELVAATGTRHVYLGHVPDECSAAAILAQTCTTVTRLKCVPLVVAPRDASMRAALPAGAVTLIDTRRRATATRGAALSRALVCSSDRADEELTIPYARCTAAIAQCATRARRRRAGGCVHFITGLSNGHALPCSLPYACFAGASFWAGGRTGDTDAGMDAVTARLFGSAHAGWRTIQQAFDDEMDALRALAGNGAATLQFRTQCFYPRDFVKTVTARFAHVGLQRVEKLTALVWQSERALAELSDAATRNQDIAGLLRLPVLFFQFLLCAFEEMGRCEQEYHLAACTEQDQPDVSRGHLIRASIALQRIAEQYGDMLELHHYLWRHCGAPRRDIKLLRAMYHHLTRLAVTVERQAKRPYPLHAFRELLQTQFARDDGHFHDRVPVPAEKL